MAAMPCLAPLRRWRAGSDVCSLQGRYSSLGAASIDRGEQDPRRGVSLGGVFFLYFFDCMDELRLLLAQPRRSRLRVVVVGGGAAGATVARFLDPHVDLVLVDIKVHATGALALVC